jgi:hypothetical protein
MENSENMNSFLSQIDSIQIRFMESLITGQRDPIFREASATRKRESEDDRNQAYIDSQRGTF